MERRGVRTNAHKTPYTNTLFKILAAATWKSTRKAANNATVQALAKRTKVVLSRSPGKEKS
jgi:hypothetical protein